MEPRSRSRKRGRPGTWRVGAADRAWSDSPTPPERGQVGKVRMVLSAEGHDQLAVRRAATWLRGNIPRRARPPVVVSEQFDPAVLPDEGGHPSDEVRVVEAPVRPLRNRIGL